MASRDESQPATGHRRWRRPITFLLLLAAAAGTVALLVAARPTNAAAFAVFAGWLLLPLAAIGGTLARVGGKPYDSALWDLGAVLVALAGILFLADVLFWRPDAQGGIAMLMTPVLQGLLGVVLLGLGAWWRRR